MLIRLATPIEHNGSTIRAIRLCQPGKVARKRILAAQGITDPLSASIEMVAALTGLTPTLVEELATDDFRNVAEAAVRFAARRRRA